MKHKHAKGEVFSVCKINSYNYMLHYSRCLCSYLNHYNIYITNLVQMVQQGPISVHVWHPLCSFIAYFIAWYENSRILCILQQSLFLFLPPSLPFIYRTLPIVLIMIPFGVLSAKYQLVQNADDCSCRYNEVLIPTHV